MSKRIIVLLGIFGFIWYLNNCTPLICDDYVYSFVWQDNAMGVALPKTAERVSGITDILISQWNHYFSWGGRTIAHSLAQLFLWIGKDLFNFANAGCFIIMLLEIQWLIDGGKIHFNFTVQDILWVFGVVWIFSVFFGDVFTWLTLACNYLWTTVLILGFLLICERYYLFSEGGIRYKEPFTKVLLFFLFGTIAGWTNENVPCFIILILGYYNFKIIKAGEKNSVLLAGMAGLLIGYILLISAPGNFVRYLRQLQDGIIGSPPTIMLSAHHVILQIFLSRFLLLYYVYKNLFLIKKVCLWKKYKQELNISLCYLFVSLASLFIMIFSPYIRYRNGFPGLILLIISAGIIRKIKNSELLFQKERDKSHILKVANLVGVVYICFTMLASVYIWSLQCQQNSIIMNQIDKAKKAKQDKVLVVQERPVLINKNFNFAFGITGGHAIYPHSLTSDENYWINQDVALYYGLQGLRMIDGE